MPDHSTIWRCHKHPSEQGLIEVLFKKINEQLAQQNIIIKTGSVSIIDDSIAHHLKTALSFQRKYGRT